VTTFAASVGQSMEADKGRDATEDDASGPDTIK
jgi:hypothetical protein